MLSAKNRPIGQVEFASPDASAYTGLAAILTACNEQVAPTVAQKSEPARNPAAERACRTPQSGRARVIFLTLRIIF
jgi:hypothetical protein